MHPVLHYPRVDDSFLFMERQQRKEYKSISDFLLGSIIFKKLVIQIIQLGRCWSWTSSTFPHLGSFWSVGLHFPLIQTSIVSYQRIWDLWWIYLTQSWLKKTRLHGDSFAIIINLRLCWYQKLRDGMVQKKYFTHPIHRFTGKN